MSTEPDGTRLYTGRGLHPLSQPMLLQARHKICVAAYMAWSGHWYAYDLTTGREIASFTKEFFEQFMRPRMTCLLIPSPDGRPYRWVEPAPKPERAQRLLARWSLVRWLRCPLSGSSPHEVTLTMHNSPDITP
jgi:hypothetical protein